MPLLNCLSRYGGLEDCASSIFTNSHFFPLLQKIKVLNRAAASSQHQQRNHDPALHPFERAREYTRALQASKMERMFAAPFVAQIGVGHQDGVYCLAKDIENTDRLASASADGIIKVWDLPTREETQKAKAHEVCAGACLTAILCRKQTGC